MSIYSEHIRRISSIKLLKISVTLILGTCLHHATRYDQQLTLRGDIQKYLASTTSRTMFRISTVLTRYISQEYMV